MDFKFSALSQKLSPSVSLNSSPFNMNDQSTYFRDYLTRILYNGNNIVLARLTNPKTPFALFTTVTHRYLIGLNMIQLLQWAWISALRFCQWFFLTSFQLQTTTFCTVKCCIIMSVSLVHPFFTHFFFSYEYEQTLFKKIIRVVKLPVCQLELIHQLLTS